MKKVYFVRHGQSEANVQKVFGYDTGLTELGREQAEIAAKHIADMPDRIDKIISSDMVRAMQTADIIARHIEYPISDIARDGRIREVEVGQLAGVSETLDKIELREKAIIAGKNEMGIESLSDLVSRIEAFVAELKELSDDTVVVVGHGQSGRMLCRVLNGIEHTKPLPIPPNAKAIEAYPVLDLHDDGGRLVL